VNHHLYLDYLFFSNLFLKLIRLNYLKLFMISTLNFEVILRLFIVRYLFITFLIELIIYKLNRYDVLDKIFYIIFKYN